METMINVHDAKTHFSKLLERVMSGERIIIAKAGKPVAVLSSLTVVPTQRSPGKDGDKVLIAEDFDAPIAEFDL